MPDTGSPTDDRPEISAISAGGVLHAGVRLISRFISEARLAFALAALGAIAFTAAIIASAVVVGHITDEVIIPVLDEGAPVEGRLTTVLWLVAAVSVWKACGIVLRRTAAGWLQFGAQTRLRKQLIAHLLGLSLRWYGTRGVGDLLSVADVDSRQATFVLAPLPFATGVVTLLLGAGVLITVTDPVLGSLAIVLLGIVVTIDLRGAWLTFAAMEEVQRRRGTVAEVAHESFDGALTVKALGREDHETARFTAATDHLRDQLIGVGRVWTWYRAVTEGLPAAGTLVILVVGTLRIVDGTLTPGGLVRIAYLVSLLTVPMRMIGYLMWDTANSVAGWRRVEQVLTTTDELPQGSTVRIDDGSAAALEVSELTFGYEPHAPVLFDVDFAVPPGHTVAIVGPTGSGKSTLALLLARLWDPDDGVVRLDGRDLRALAPGTLPAEVAYVAQETFLFDDTVIGNVLLDHGVDAAAVRDALRLADAETFVDQLPDGLATNLGERGTSLSGGQQQRIALARALVRRPRLLVLDDATSALDPTVEARILRSLAAAELPATVIIVAYRRASIMLADEVVFLDAGRIVAHGSHDDLLAHVPGYARLLNAYAHDVAPRHASEASLPPSRDPSGYHEGSAHPDVPSHDRRRDTRGERP